MLCYIGPGGALSAIGSFLALLAAVFLALLGFVWYPIKRMLRARRAAKAGSQPQTGELQTALASESSVTGAADGNTTDTPERKVEV